MATPGDALERPARPAFGLPKAQQLRLDRAPNLGAIDGWYGASHCDFWDQNFP